MGTVLLAAADVLVDQDPDSTAVLQGAGEAFAPAFQHASHHVEAHERAVAILETTLGTEQRHALHDRGMAMTDAEAVDYAKAAIARALDGPMV